MHLDLPEKRYYSIGELANRIVDLTRSSSLVSYGDLPDDDPKQRRPDITLAKSKLGWHPKTALEQGLVPTVAHFAKVILGEDRMDQRRLWRS